ncbi:MAG: glycoside hydrolase family 3 C-terminal domain-containing protein [Bacteroidota bacterium]
MKISASYRCFFFACLIFSTLLASAQEYPFQNTELSDDQRIDNLISLMTLEEKIDHLSPFLPGVPRLGVKGTRTVEGLHGVALSGPANWAVKGKGAAPTTTFPQAYGLAQTWDPELHQELAAWEAHEARYLAQNENYRNLRLIVFAPNADLGRDIRWGRTEECYGEDAYLAGVMTTAYVRGLQGDDPNYWKTASLMKHFLANSNENIRIINSSDFDDRLFREYYGYAFWKGITGGGSRAYMAAYNKYNGIPCTVHPVLKEVTVEEWGQDGIICTDGGAFSLLVTSHHYFPGYPEAAAACIQAGINMFLDRYKPALKEALERGLTTEEEIDQVLRGTLRVMLRLGLLDDSPGNPYTGIGIQDTVRPWTLPQAAELVRRATSESVVLMKNEGLLPLALDQLGSVAVIGPVADTVISDWYAGTPPYSVTVLDGIRKAAGDRVTVRYAASNKADSAVIAARESDVAIVCIGNHPLGYGLAWGENYVASDGREEVDREAISLEQEDLVRLVRAANPNTVLVLVSSFPYAIPWSKEHVPSILHITQSSQELGNGLADILFGKVSPAGRLVQTWTASMDQLLPILDYNIRNGRTYMYDQHKPLFAFGHGLSYTSFEYSGLELGKASLREGEALAISLEVKNTGEVDSDEVVQLYVRHPGSEVDRPNLALKGFKRIHIRAGESKRVSLPLEADELRYWSEAGHAFVLEKGEVEVMIGASSEDIRLQGILETK